MSVKSQDAHARPPRDGVPFLTHSVLPFVVSSLIAGRLLSRYAKVSTVIAF